MFELSLCVTGYGEQYIKKNSKALKSKILDCGGVFSIYEKGQFVYYLIVANQNEAKVKKLVLDFICDCVLNIYKRREISKAIKYDFPKDIKYFALLQALINFDIECDYNYICQKIDFSSGEFYMYSFYLFKCALLREKWSQLIAITNQNAKLLNVEENYLDVLRFLIEGITQKNSIEVAVEENCFVVKSSNETFHLTSYKSLVDYIIKHNPKKLTLKNIDKNFITFMKKLFLTRVVVSM